MRGHGSDDGNDARLGGAGRRSDRLRAVLRELRARRGHERGDAQVRDAAGPGLRVRRGRAAGGVRTAYEGDHRELAEQPERQGVRPRGAGPDRGALPGIRLPLLHRRDLRAHPLRRPPAPPDVDAAGDVRPHGDDQRALEDVQRDRVAARVRGRAAPPERGDSQGARLPDGGGARAAAAGGSGRAGAGGVLLPGVAVDVPGEAGPAPDRAAGGRVHLPQAGGGLLRNGGLRRPRLRGGRHSLRAQPDRAGGRRAGAGLELLQRPDSGVAVRAFHLLEVGRDAGGGGAAAGGDLRGCLPTPGHSAIPAFPLR